MMLDDAARPGERVVARRWRKSLARFRLQAVEERHQGHPDRPPTLSGGRSPPSAAESASDEAAVRDLAVLASDTRYRPIRIDCALPGRAFAGSRLAISASTRHAAAGGPLRQASIAGPRLAARYADPHCRRIGRSQLAPIALATVQPRKNTPWTPALRSSRLAATSPADRSAATPDAQPHCARWSSFWSASTSATIASTTGAPRMPTQGSWRPLVRSRSPRPRGRSSRPASGSTRSA